MRGMKHRSRGMLAGLGAGLLSIVTGATVLAVDDFSTPVRIFDQNYYELDVTSDNDGDIHAVARGDTGLWYLTDTGGSWSRERLTTFGFHEHDGDPSIAVDGADNAYITFESDWCDDCAPGGNDGIGLLTNKSGDFPHQPTLIHGNSATDPSIAVRNGKVYIAYSLYCCLPDQEDAQLWLYTNASGSGTKTKIRNDGRNPSLVVNGAGRPRVAFDSNGIRFASAATKIGDWTVDKVPGTNSNDVRPHLDYDFGPNIAFTGADGTYIAWRTGGDWVHEGITGARGNTDFSADDSFHIVAIDENDGGVSAKSFLYSDTISGQAVARDVGITVRPNGTFVVMFIARTGIPPGIYISHD